ncbi:MAG: hypothetical protein E7353_03330 [Clostridiales bacterium]|nr:hypothetical protein [Clostridiales bacterium]
MQTNKKSLILSSPFGSSGMVTFTRMGKNVNFAVTVFTKGKYKIVLKGVKVQEWEVFSPHSTFLLPDFDFDSVGVGIYVDGQLFCKGGFFEEVENEESKIDASDESEDSESEAEQKEVITYMDDAVATENYYPEDIRVVCEENKSVAVLLSFRINDYVENQVEGLFNCKIKRKKEEPRNNDIKRKNSVFIKKPFEQDEVASTVFPIDAMEFSRKAFYYEQIKDKIDALFKAGEREDSLTKLMPDTRWVKIEYSPTQFYVVGIVGREGGMPDYICYGVPSSFSRPIECLGKHARWVPVDVRDPQGSGYWLLFQSAKTGETIKND